jgi:cytoskeletal protein RodZ
MTRTRACVMPTLGRLFHDTRIASGHSLKSLEHTSRIPAHTLRDIEAGSVAHVTLSNVVRIARVLGLTPDAVFAAAADDLQRAGDGPAAS